MSVALQQCNRPQEFRILRHRRPLDSPGDCISPLSTGSAASGKKPHVNTQPVIIINAGRWYLIYRSEMARSPWIDAPVRGRPLEPLLSEPAPWARLLLHRKTRIPNLQGQTMVFRKRQATSDSNCTVQCFRCYSSVQKQSAW